MSAHSGACEEVPQGASATVPCARRDRAVIWRESSRAVAPTSSVYPSWDKPDQGVTKRGYRHTARVPAG